MLLMGPKELSIIIFQPFYIQIAALTLYYYDYILTFGAEVSLIWPQPLSMNTFLFFSNRYISFFGNISAFILFFAPLSDSWERSVLYQQSVTNPKLKGLVSYSCSIVIRVREALLVLGQVLVAATLATRTIALYGRSRTVTIGVLSFGSLIVGVTCWTLVAGRQSTGRQYIPGAPGCRNFLSEEFAIHLAIAWEASALFDLFIFALTLTRTLKMRKAHNLTNSSNLKAGLLGLILRDGALYFFVMALANSANIFSFYYAPSLSKATFTTPASCVASTLCSRLVLNLYDVATQDGTADSDSSSGSMTTGIFTTRFELSTSMDHDSRNQVKSGWV